MKAEKVIVLLVSLELLAIPVLYLIGQINATTIYKEPKYKIQRIVQNPNCLNGRMY